MTVTTEAIERLRAESSRGDYASMARLARALYDAGLGPREVLHRCYGVDFPEEFFVLLEAELDGLSLMIRYTAQPWELAVPLVRGDPAPSPFSDDIQRKIYARDPDLVPLGLLLGEDGNYRWHPPDGTNPGRTKWIGIVPCYRLTELEVGRTTVFGVGEEVTSRDEVVRLGESFLAVLHEHHVDELRVTEWEFRHPANRGAGSVDLEDLKECQSMIERVEELLRQVASAGA
jgi:hypothetical protein